MNFPVGEDGRGYPPSPSRPFNNAPHAVSPYHSATGGPRGPGGQPVPPGVPQPLSNVSGGLGQAPGLRGAPGLSQVGYGQPQQPGQGNPQPGGQQGSAPSVQQGPPGSGAPGQGVVGGQMMGNYGPMGNGSMAPGGGSGLMPGMDLHQGAGVDLTGNSPAFDLSSDFPALGPNRISHGMARATAANVLKQGQMAPQSQEFRMQNEDFPALPGQDGPGGRRAPGPDGAGREGGPQGGGQGRGATANTDYGLLGLLNVIRMTEPDLNMLSLGTDLTTLGLNLNSNQSLHSSFSSPWTDMPHLSLRDDSLPQCYRANQAVPLRQGLMSKFAAETLFWIFYSTPKDLLQAAAAKELFARDWRYHNDTKLWFTRAPHDEFPNYFVYFDVSSWDKKLAQPQDMKALANAWELMPPDVTLPQ